MIQIILPIFNAYEVTKNAIEALLLHNLNDDVLIINDASTDKRIESLLIGLPINWHVINNSSNMGFVKTANIGLKQSSGHSILLNSDTLVSFNWLDRFIEVVTSVSHVGTATPWSNNAEICSLPVTLFSNPLPSDINKLAKELFENHQPQFPELPTAVGFCMLISAQAKQQVGYFDEATFGMGYGEENDYSLRVKSSGLKNVLVDNCYVAHIGNQSFQEISMQPDEQTMVRLLQKHPNYLKIIQNYIENDPLAELRESIVVKISGF